MSSAARPGAWCSVRDLEGLSALVVLIAILLGILPARATSPDAIRSRPPQRLRARDRLIAIRQQRDLPVVSVYHQ